MIVQINKCINLIITICLLALASCSSQSIYYEHVGYCDKPFPSIELKVSGDSIANYNRYNRLFSIDQEDFKRLSTFITEDELQKKKNGSDDEFPYGSYQLKVKKNTYLLPNKSASLTFFENHSKIITDDKIKQEFDLIIKRLK